MISYRDRSFCSESHCCANEQCPRNLTEAEREKARLWWGGDDFPVAYMQLKHPECGFVPRATERES